MIIARAPYRVSFFGGGTDYEGWYSKHGGAVLTSTLDHYCYIVARRTPPFLGAKYRVTWSKAEMVNRIEDIQHPSVRGCLTALGVTHGVEINHAGGLPARSGLGSSSAFTVAMLHALHALRRESPGPAQLAAEAINVEQNVLGETVGIQDQIECAWGGLNHIVIHPDGQYTLSPVMLPDGTLTRLEAHLMLFFTGIQRHASEIAATQVANAERKESELRRIADLVPLAVACLNGDDLTGFGTLLHETWMLKRELSGQVSTPVIDNMYDLARTKGALGGKVLGAGGGGFLLLFVPPEHQVAVREGLGHLIEVPFQFGEEGSRVVFHDAR